MLLHQMLLLDLNAVRKISPLNPTPEAQMNGLLIVLEERGFHEKTGRVTDTIKQTFFEHLISKTTCQAF